jgi:hypothetical protein
VMCASVMAPNLMVFAVERHSVDQRNDPRGRLSQQGNLVLRLVYKAQPRNPLHDLPLKLVIGHRFILTRRADFSTLNPLAAENSLSLDCRIRRGAREQRCRSCRCSCRPNLGWLSTSDRADTRSRRGGHRPGDRMMGRSLRCVRLDLDPSRRVQRLTTSVAIRGVADIGWPAAGWTRSQVTPNRLGRP